MLRNTFTRLETAVISSWLPKKSFGFATIGTGDNAKNVFVHQSAIIQARNQRPLQTIRKGVEIQLDLTTDDQGRVTAKNVTSIGGKTLTNRDEIPSTTVDVKALRGRLIDNDDDSRHGQALRGIVQSINTIAMTQRRTSALNRKIAQMLNALAEKEGIKDILSGDEYKAAKEVVLANPLREAAARREQRDDDDDDHDDAVEEEVVTSSKAEVAKEAPRLDRNLNTAEDLLELMEEVEVKETKPKGKKGKKN